MREEFEHEFLMGRMHITTQTTITSPKPKFDFSEKISKLLTESKQFKENEKRTYVWVFANVRTIESEGNKLFYGVFAKVREKGMENFYDPDSRVIKKGYRDKLITQTSSIFIINPKYQTIIFEEKTGIKLRPFKKAFENIYGEFYKGMTTIEIDLIKEETALLQILNNKTVIEIAFELVPSNPNMRPEWEVLDNLGKRAGAKKISIALQNRIDGLKFGTDGMAGQGVALSGAGYGNFEAKVKDRSGTRTVSSKNNVVRRNVNLPSGFDPSENIIKSILKVFKKYTERDKE